MQLCALQFASQLLSGTSDAQVDWLIAKPSSTSTFTAAACWPEYGMDPPICVLELSNGLISRRWVASPGFGTIDMVLNATAEFGGEQSMFRALEPEALLVLDNVSYTVGGLESPPVHNTSRRFESFRALLLGTDSSELERHHLQRHRLTQLLAPQTTENPIFSYVVPELPQTDTGAQDLNGRDTDTAYHCAEIGPVVVWRAVGTHHTQRVAVVRFVLTRIHCQKLVEPNAVTCIEGVAVWHERVPYQQVPSLPCDNGRLKSSSARHAVARHDLLHLCFARLFPPLLVLRLKSWNALKGTLLQQHGTSLMCKMTVKILP